MHHVAVTFALLSKEHTTRSIADFMNLTPIQGLDRLLDSMPQEQRFAVLYAFPPEALMLILEHEFEASVPRQTLVFKRPRIEPQSWLYAAGRVDCPEPTGQQKKIESAVEAIWHRIRTGMNYFPELDRQTITELTTLLCLYWYRERLANPTILEEMQSEPGQIRFLNSIVARAMACFDAARVLFGYTSPYTDAWIHKQQEYTCYAGLYRAPFASRLVS